MGQCGNLTKMYFDLNNVCVMKLERRKRISSNSANTCNLTGIFRLRQIEEAVPKVNPETACSFLSETKKGLRGEPFL